MNNRFLSGEAVIESLRDNGYSNTAYALGELIDNSIQAGASLVELGFIEEQETDKARRSYTVREISIWDNGSGMRPETLTLAMQFGGSENRNNPAGMGKFGMGLPNSSISQCKRVDVWSWIRGGVPTWTYLDVDEMKAGKLEEVPIPIPKDIPTKYLKAHFGTKFPESGTLIVWSKLDRLNWKTGRSIYKHCEALVGRLYRHFITNEQVKIDSVSYRPLGENLLSVYERNSFKANDPLYLSRNTSLPELPGPYKNEAFFEELECFNVPVKYVDESGQIKTSSATIRTSVAKQSIIDEIKRTSKTKPGSTKYGKHCMANQGVSIVRAGRELVLRDSLLKGTAAEEKGRFAGIEIQFGPELDKVFGVTNNKQDAVKLVRYDYKKLMIEHDEEFDTEEDYLRALEADEDPIVEVFKVARAIDQAVLRVNQELKKLNVEINKMAVDDEGGNISKVARQVTEASNHRESAGYTATGYAEPASKDELAEEIGRAYNVSEKEARKKVDDILLTGTKFHIDDVPLDSEAFFDVSTHKGLTMVLLNTNHIFYRDFVSKLDNEQRDVIQIVLAGFARVMNETIDERRRSFLEGVRRNWGKIVSEFLGETDFDLGDDF